MAPKFDLSARFRIPIQTMSIVVRYKEAAADAKTRTFISVTNGTPGNNFIATATNAPPVHTGTPTSISSYGHPIKATQRAWEYVTDPVDNTFWGFRCVQEGDYVGYFRMDIVTSGTSGNTQFVVGVNEFAVSEGGPSTGAVAYPAQNRTGLSKGEWRNSRQFALFVPIGGYFFKNDWLVPMSNPYTSSGVLEWASVAIDVV